jgi:outer membrane receptor for ferrienterochelin and colicins
MTLRAIAATCFVCLYCCAANAQRLTVLNSVTHKSVPNQKLTLVSLRKGCKEQHIATNRAGSALLPTDSGCYPYTIKVIGDTYVPVGDTLLLPESRTMLFAPNALNMDEVVVTAQYAPGSLNNAVQRIEVIDLKKIDAMAAQNLRDVLTNQLDIRMAQDPIFGVSMSMQGSKSYGADAKILIDGVPVTGKQNGAIDLSQINLANIERIEIIKGPMSVSYGTDAIAGAVNLITRKKPAHDMEAGATVYYESIGTYNITARAGFRKKKHALVADGSRNFFDGWKPGEPMFDIDYAARPADTLRTSLWKPREQYIGNIQYTYAMPHTTLTYKGSYFNELIVNRGSPLLPYREMAFDDQYRTYRKDNAVFINTTLSDHKRINVLLAYNHYQRLKNTYTNDLTTLQTTLTPDAQDTSVYSELNSRGTYSAVKPNAKINYELGYDVNVQFVNSSQIAERKQQMGNYALFASAEYRLLSKLTLRPGLRYGYNTRYAAPLIPSVNLLWKANSQYDIRASYGKGFRQPGLKELFFDFVDINHNIYGNTGLKAEYADNYSLAISYRGRRNNMGYKLNGSAFYNNIQNLITLAAVAGGAINEYTYVNIGQFKTQGAQLSGDVSYKAVTLSAGGTLTGTYNQLSETGNVPQFSYSPEVRGSATVNIAKLHISIALFYKYTGRFAAYTADANNQPQQVFSGSYQIADLTVAKQIFKNHINISAGCKNLFNVSSVASFQSGGAHTSAAGSTSISTGRYYFLKMDINMYKP